MTLKVFVFTSVYNDEKNIKESIQSILSQTYKNFKYFIINDGSTDNTKKEIEEAILGDSRVSFINLKKNIGIVENRNNLFKLNFDYALIQDSDDISHPKRIETQVKFMEAHKNVIASGAFLNIINEEGKIIGNRKYNLNDNEIRNQFFSSCPVPFPTLIIRKLSKIKLEFDNKYFPAEDLEFIIKLGKYGKYANVPNHLLNYRIRNESLTFSKMKIMEKSSIKIRLKLLKEKPYTYEISNYIYMLLYLILYIFPSSFKYFLLKIIKFN